MTKREKQIQSMLNFYGIQMSDGRDEKMSKKDQKNFLDRFNSNYDAHTVQDIISKISDKFRNKKDDFDEENDDPFFKNLNKQSDDLDSPFPIDPNSHSDRRIGYNDDIHHFGFGSMNPEIEKFIGWISDLLYSADHKVIITEEGDITNVRLEKIKKKRGGRKK